MRRVCGSFLIEAMVLWKLFRMRSYDSSSLLALMLKPCSNFNFQNRLDTLCGMTRFSPFVCVDANKNILTFWVLSCSSSIVHMLALRRFSSDLMQFSCLTFCTNVWQRLQYLYRPPRRNLYLWQGVCSCPKTTTWRRNHVGKASLRLPVSITTSVEKYNPCFYNRLI